MKLLTIGVLVAAVVGMCGCTAPTSSNVPSLTNVTHNTTAIAKVNKTVKTVTPTATPIAATPTPAYVATPTPANVPVATPTPTAYPTIRNLHGEDQSKYVPAATPTPTQAPTFTWSVVPQAPVMQGAYPMFMCYYNSHMTEGPNYTPHWYIDGREYYTGMPTSSYASSGPDTSTLSLGAHTVTVDAMGLPQGTLTLSYTFTVIPAA